MKNSIITLMILMVISCTRDTTPLPDTANCLAEDITYAKHVESIMTTNCSFPGCHQSAFDEPPRLDGYERVADATLDPSFLKSIKHESGSSPMPYPPGSSRLDICDILTIEAWIQAGLPQ